MMLPTQSCEWQNRSTSSKRGSQVFKFISTFTICSVARGTFMKERLQETTHIKAYIIADKSSDCPFCEPRSREQNLRAQLFEYTIDQDWVGLTIAIVCVGTLKFRLVADTSFRYRLHEVETNIREGYHEPESRLAETA